MSIKIADNYNSYYTQGSNSVTAAISSAKAADKNVSKEEFFKNVCNKYPGVNANMSNSYLMQKNKITYNFSPEFVSKAMTNPDAAEKLNSYLEQTTATEQYINAHKYFGNHEVESVSFVIDENGECSCKVEFKQKDSNDKADEEKMNEKRMKRLKEKAKYQKHLKNLETADILSKSKVKDSKITEIYEAADYYDNSDVAFDTKAFDRNI